MISANSVKWNFFYSVPVFISMSKGMIKSSFSFLGKLQEQVRKYVNFSNLVEVGRCSNCILAKSIISAREIMIN